MLLRAARLKVSAGETATLADTHFADRHGQDGHADNGEGQR